MQAVFVCICLTLLWKCRGISSRVVLAVFMDVKVLWCASKGGNLRDQSVLIGPVLCDHPSEHNSGM